MHLKVRSRVSARYYLVIDLKPIRKVFEKVVLAFAVCLAGTPVWADASNAVTEVVISHYEQAVQHQQQTMKNVAMDVTMEASIPKLKKQGKLSALRVISRVGRVTYKVLGFSGDDTVKKEVIARYMTAEVDANQSRSTDLAI